MCSLYDQVAALFNNHTNTVADKLERWASSIENGSQSIEEARKQFHALRPLAPYVSVSRAGRAKAPDRVCLSLRFHGHEVAEVRVQRGGVWLCVLPRHVRDTPRLPAQHKGPPLGKGCHPWAGDEPVRKFRSFFKDLDASPQQQWPECRVEADIIVKMRARRKTSLRYIRPVEVAGLPLQMPVPISAHGGKPKLAASNRPGYIDILARRGRGRAGHPAVWELKQPHELAHAVPQAYIYAATLLQVLRYPKLGDRWYSLLGFGGRVPASIVVDTVVAVSEDIRPMLERQFTEHRVQETIPTDVGPDTIEPYVAYYKINEGRLEIQDPVPLDG